MLSVAQENLNGNSEKPKPPIDLETNLMESKMTMMLNTDSKFIGCKID
jgi:hypothetical protein